MKKIFFLSVLLNITFLYSQNRTGIQTETPQKTLHVNGSLQLTNELNLGGNATTAGTTGTTGQFFTSGGAGQSPTWNTINLPTFPSLTTGTVIAINGTLMIAQEINALVTQDEVYNGVAGLTVPFVIKSLTTEIIDNGNSFTSNATTNSFRVAADGVYSVMMNMTISNSPIGGQSPVIGVWCDTDSRWVARVNDMFSPDATTGRQTYTLITAINLEAAKTYSFRTSNTETYTITAEIDGKKISSASVKRLK